MILSLSVRYFPYVASLHCDTELAACHICYIFRTGWGIGRLLRKRAVSVFPWHSRGAITLHCGGGSYLLAICAYYEMGVYGALGTRDVCISPAPVLIIII